MLQVVEDLKEQTDADKPTFVLKMNLLVTETSHGVSIYNSDDVRKSRYIPIPNTGCAIDGIVRTYCDILDIHPIIYNSDPESVARLLAGANRQMMVAEIGNGLCLLGEGGKTLHEVRTDDLFLSAVSVLFKEISDAEKILGRRPMTERQALNLNKFLVNIFSTATRRVDSFCSPFWGSVNLERISVVDTLDGSELYKIWPVSINAQDALNARLLEKSSVIVRDFGLASDNCVIAITNYYLRNVLEKALEEMKKK